MWAFIHPRGACLCSSLHFYLHIQLGKRRQSANISRLSFVSIPGLVSSGFSTQGDNHEVLRGYLLECILYEIFSAHRRLRTCLNDLRDLFWKERILGNHLIIWKFSPTTYTFIHKLNIGCFWTLWSQDKLIEKRSNFLFFLREIRTLLVDPRARIIISLMALKKIGWGGQIGKIAENCAKKNVEILKNCQKPHENERIFVIFFFFFWGGDFCRDLFVNLIIQCQPWVLVLDYSNIFAFP